MELSSISVGWRTSFSSLRSTMSCLFGRIQLFFFSLLLFFLLFIWFCFLFQKFHPTRKDQNLPPKRKEERARVSEWERGRERERKERKRWEIEKITHTYTQKEPEKENWNDRLHFCAQVESREIEEDGGTGGEGGLVEEANWLMKWPEKEYWKKKNW